MQYALLSTFFFGITLIFIKLSTPKISPLLGSMLFPAAAFVVQFLTVLILRARGEKFHITNQGMALAGIGGIFLGFYAIFLFYAFSKIGVSRATPLIYIGAIIIATVFGVVFLKESFGLTNIIGLILACTGLALLFIK